MARNLFLICLAFALAPFATAQALVPMPAQPDGQAWPTAGWETGELPPESADTIHALLEGFMAVAVVSRTFLRIFQAVIRLADRLEFRFRLGIARIAIRVILHGEPAVGRLEHLVVG